jgi:glutamate--cysteine ligase catalytic subunit
MHIKVPMFIDTNTAARLLECPVPGGEQELYMSGLPNETRRRDHTIEMDAMCFGMGMCCLQVTFQARDIGESRHLYDQLAVLTPIMLALSAATPVLKGRLADTDVRWATIAASVDDRTPQERGLDVCEPTHKGQTPWMAGGGKRRLAKSRYESISSYICNCKDGAEDNSNTDKYNDIECPVDEAALATLVGAGVDKTLSRHIAHLFVRDPLVIHTHKYKHMYITHTHTHIGANTLGIHKHKMYIMLYTHTHTHVKVIYSERIHLADSENTDHFENIQSTNWQTVRWKPPPPNSDIGWRVEFRSMEAQLTDFENAAYTILTVLLSRVLLYFRLNLYIPLSKVDENMATAHKRNAVIEQKFWFRKHMAHDVPPDADEYELMTISEILTGTDSQKHSP